jgi:glycosyltransferase involved in cell wall biosynthesis
MVKKIAFGATRLDQGLLGPGIDGIGYYCKELLQEFSNETYLQIQPFSFGVKNSPSHAICLPRYTTYLKTSLIRKSVDNIWPSQVNNWFDEADLVHSTDQLIPFGIKKPLITTVMDTIPLTHPQFIRSTLAPVKALLWKKLAQQSAHIITISEFSKAEIAEHMDFPLERISAIALGVGEEYFERIEKSAIEHVLTKYAISKKFFLTIGSIQPRKNIKRILLAHATLPKEMATEFPIILIGKLAWDDGTILDSIRQSVLQNRCIWLDYVTDFEKRCLLQASSGLVFASLYEGFGLPILEAYASRTPVITSDNTAMPEIAGNAAILVNASNIDALAVAFLRLIHGGDSINQLTQRAYERAKEYSWKSTALATKSVYEKLL